MKLGALTALMGMMGAPTAGVMGYLTHPSDKFKLVKRAKPAKNGTV